CLSLQANGLSRVSASAVGPSGMSATSPMAIPRSHNSNSSQCMVGRTGSAPSLLGTSPVNARKVGKVHEARQAQVYMGQNPIYSDVLQWSIVCTMYRLSRPDVTLHRVRCCWML